LVIFLLSMTLPKTVCSMWNRVLLVYYTINDHITVCICWSVCDASCVEWSECSFLALCFCYLDLRFNFDDLQSIWTQLMLKLPSSERHWNLLQLNKSTWELVMQGIVTVSSFLFHLLTLFYLEDSIVVVLLSFLSSYIMYTLIRYMDTLLFPPFGLTALYCHSYLPNSVLFVANESTHKRVIFYTVGEYLLLAAVSALQVIYIRRLFSKSVAYNRVWVPSLCNLMPFLLLVKLS
jgi:hypothetical protein